MQLGPLGFASPLLLIGLLALPVLWWLLRATPPAPIRERFPGVAILLGMEPPEKTPQHTPWWLLLLRMAIAALAILAFAQPLLNPRESLSTNQPLRLVMDAGWASAPDWDARLAAAGDLLDQADRAGVQVELNILGQDAMDAERASERLAADDARARLDALTPSPWPPNRSAMMDRLAETEPMQTVWLHDGLDHGGLFAGLAEGFAENGSLRLIGPESTIRAVLPQPPEGGGLGARVLRAASGTESASQVIGYSAEDNGTRRALAVAKADFGIDDTEADTVFEAPLELRNRIAMFGIEGTAHAGATALIDDRWRRRKVGLVSGERSDAGQRLLSGAHYVRKALEGRTELREGTIDDLVDQDVDILILVDVGAFPEGEAETVTQWLDEGGVLVRFAGPTLAATTEERRANFGRGVDDPLLPVRLRPGGRDLGGAMSWGEPQKIASYAEDSPFAGLKTPEDARITRQVLAEPDIDLPTRTWASLTDGAPLVTSDRRGDGRIVLFHTSADPRWSTLPLSGLFVEMLDRIVKFGVGGTGQAGIDTDGFWSPIALIGADGALREAPEAAQSIEGALLGQPASSTAPPGLYEAIGGKDAGATRAHNLLPTGSTLTAAPPPPSAAVIETLGERKETELKPWFLAAALALLMLDALAALTLAGKLRGAVAGLALALLSLSAANDARAQDADDQALIAALDGSLGYVVTGDSKADDIAQAGLYGLTRILIERTSVEPGEPQGVNLETDELAVYPLIYWGISPNQPRPSDEAIAKLNDYMRRGGMLLIDTRDQNLALGSGETPGSRALRRLTAGLDLPPLSPVPEGHVLHRSFFLLEDFPGRWRGGKVWVEAAPPEDIEKVAKEGGFKNDGVSPIIVGGRDWAGAWAVTDEGRSMLPMSGRGGERQRELAFRFGINLVMYAYTGSYKSDQVHIPALLQRLGQ